MRRLTSSKRLAVVKINSFKQDDILSLKACPRGRFRRGSIAWNNRVYCTCSACREKVSNWHASPAGAACRSCCPRSVGTILARSPRWPVDVSPRRVTWPNGSYAEPGRRVRRGVETC